MKTWRIQLEIPSGYITPWHSDTIFGHLCWVAEHHDLFKGFKGAAGLIDLYRQGNPPFILSDGFPGDWLPAPVTLKNLFEPAESDGLNKTAYNTLKSAKKLKFVTLSQFQDFCSGKRFELPSGVHKPLVNSITLHNQIDRLSNTTGSAGGGLFEIPEQFATEGLISIYAYVADGYEQDLQELFRLMAQGGYGKKRTTGKGAFILKSFEQFNGFEQPENSDVTGFITLSHYVPSKDDPTDGAWRLLVKYGKLGDEKTFCGNPFKKPLIMLQPGAVFRTSVQNKWYGRLVDNIAFSDAQPVQYGFCFAVPVY